MLRNPQTNEMTAAELAALFDRACVAACDCLTKTPDPAFHAATCRYALFARLASGLRAFPASAQVLSWEEAREVGDTPLPYIRLDLGLGKSDEALRRTLSDLAAQLRALLPLARFHEADPRPLMAALSKAEAILSTNPPIRPLENRDDG